MTLSRPVLFIRLCFTGLLLSISAPVMAENFDWQQWNSLLGEAVSGARREGVMLNVVDYPLVMKDVRYQETIQRLSKYDPAKIINRDDKLAFYINLYNIFAVKMVVDHWQPESIRDIGGFFSSVWKKDVGILGGESITLHEIEHEVLRPMGEPRIHFAIVCASVSCPDLRRETYRPDKLDSQLDEQTRMFLNNTAKGLRVKAGEIHISSIFDWFEQDFKPYGGVKQFIYKFRQDLPRRYAVETDIPYNWRLNY